MKATVHRPVGSEPFGITVDSARNPWYTMMSANKIAEFQLR
jgi:hypothetical protein